MYTISCGIWTASWGLGGDMEWPIACLGSKKRSEYA
jgi:hypothetical protein